MGAVPMRNYTTNVFPEDNKYVPEYMREHFKSKPAACWACAIAHCRIMEVTEGHVHRASWERSPSTRERPRWVR